MVVGRIVTYGTLFHDDDCANTFEAIVGTLKAAKKRKIINFPGQLLLSPMHDSVEVKLAAEHAGSADNDAAAPAADAEE